MPKKNMPAQASRNSAKVFDYGNMVVILLPVLIPFWFGASIFVYAMMRHHPNPKVGDHTQWAAYRFYGMIGALIPIGTFFPVDIRYYLVTWAVIIAVMIPWTFWALRKINHDDWQDIEYESDA